MGKPPLLNHRIDICCIDPFQHGMMYHYHSYVNKWAKKESDFVDWYKRLAEEQDRCLRFLDKSLADKNAVIALDPIRLVVLKGNKATFAFAVKVKEDEQPEFSY